MVDWIKVSLLGISFIAFAIAGGFITNASQRITDIPNAGSNPKLNSAHKWSAIAAVIVWITVALLVIGFILVIIFSPEEAEAGTAEEGLTVEASSKSSFSFLNIVIYGLLFLILAGVITVGILSAITANDIRTSGVPDNNNSEKQAIIGASISIVVFVFVLIALIVQFTYKPKKKQGDILSQLEKDPTFQEM